MSHGKWIAAVDAIAHEFGYRVAGRTKNSHLRLTRPRYPTIFTSSTPSDHRTLKNLRSQLRKAKEKK